MSTMGKNKQVAPQRKQDQTSQPEIPITALQKLKQNLLDNFDMMELFHLSRNTLYNLRKAKKLAYIRIGRRIYYFLEDVMIFLQNNKMPGLGK